MKPGEIVFAEGRITLNAGRPTVELDVENTSDHVIFVSSHFPFFEVNRRMLFDRARAWGMRLDIPAGTAVRFEPGVEREVHVVPIGGARVIVGLRPEWAGPLEGGHRGA